MKSTGVYLEYHGYVEVIWHYRPYSLIKHMYFTSISRILLYPEDACFRSCMHEVLDYNVWEVYRCVFQHFVTLWFCVHFQFTYWFDDLQSMDESLLYRPLLSIPSSGVIPGGPKSKCAMQGVWRHHQLYKAYHLHVQDIFLHTVSFWYFLSPPPQKKTKPKTKKNQGI